MGEREGEREGERMAGAVRMTSTRLRVNANRRASKNMTTTKRTTNMTRASASGAHTKGGKVAAVKRAVQGGGARAAGAAALFLSGAMPAVAAPEGVGWNIVAPTSDNLPALMVPLICLLLPACAMAQLFVYIEKYVDSLCFEWAPLRKSPIETVTQLDSAMIDIAMKKSYIIAKRLKKEPLCARDGVSAQANFRFFLYKNTDCSGVWFLALPSAYTPTMFHFAVCSDATRDQIE